MLANSCYVEKDMIYSVKYETKSRFNYYDIKFNKLTYKNKNKRRDLDLL